MKQLTMDQSRIRQAFNKMPFGGICNIRYIEAQDSSEEMFIKIADTLESLLITLESQVSLWQTIETEHAAMRSDIEATRRLLGHWCQSNA